MNKFPPFLLSALLLCLPSHAQQISEDYFQTPNASDLGRYGGEEESKNAISPAITPAIIYTGATEYSGDIIYKDGKLHKVLFPGGYCTFNHETSEPQFHYFTQDHLGNNRAVVSESGEVEQITHYYPFGCTFGDAGLNPALQ